MFSLWCTIFILEKRPTDLGRVSPHPGTPPRADLLTTPQTVTELVILLPNLGWALTFLRCWRKGGSVMLLVATARCHHICVRPWARGFQSLLLCWTSWTPLSRSIYSLDHHQTQQWVRNQITENNWGCCISGHAKQPTINYSVKTKCRHFPGEVAVLQLWGRAEARHPTMARWVLSCSVLLLQCW